MIVRLSVSDERHISFTQTKFKHSLFLEWKTKKVKPMANGGDANGASAEQKSCERSRRQMEPLARGNT